MVIIIDTREQRMFFEKPPKGIVFMRDNLKAGDYSIKGFEDKICIERKSPDDFLTSITSDSKRFKNRLTEMNDYEIKIIVVECELSRLIEMCTTERLTKKRLATGRFKPSDNKRMIHPNVVKGSVTSIFTKYCVPIYFAMGRKDAEEFTLSILTKYYKLKRSE